MTLSTYVIIGVALYCASLGGMFAATLYYVRARHRWEVLNAMLVNIAVQSMRYRYLPFWAAYHGTMGRIQITVTTGVDAAKQARADEEMWHVRPKSL